MLTFFDRLVEVNFTSAAVRMLLAVLCGGIIGMEVRWASAPISSSAWGRL